MRYTKVLAFIDVTVQTILLGGVVIMSLRVLMEGGWAASERVIFTAMVGAMFLGPWQMLSSIITTAARVPQFRLRAIHVVSSIIYLVVVFGTNAVSTSAQLNEMSNPFSMAFVYGTPALLAFFYYYITLRT